MPGPIRVLLAISSPLTLKALENLLAQAPDIEIVGTARRGREVPDLVKAARPHLLCVEDASPALDGLEITGEVMRAQPCPILVLAASPKPARRDALLEAGALDYVARPEAGILLDSVASHSFIARLKLLSRVPVIGRRSSGQSATASWAVPTLAAPRKLTVKESPHPAILPANTGERRIVAIGASTGGPIALMTILSSLPANFPHPIVCVQHVSRGFLSGLISWLDQGCHLRVAIAQAGEIPPMGTVLFPPEDRHLEIAPSGRVRLNDAPPRDGHRPSATVLLESVANSYGPRATAILLTGMGNDGARGLCAVREAGGDTIAQNEASCVVYGMPRVAIECGGAKHTGSPEEIARRLLLLC